MKRRDFLRGTTAATVTAATQALGDLPAWAQANRDALLAISESGANSMDPHTAGANRGAYEVAWNCYDRLLSYEIKRDGATERGDSTRLRPELAEDWNETDTNITLKLRRDAVFHDGTPVTAKDVKWSYDRMIAAGGVPKFQFSQGSLLKEEQFVAVDDHTFRIDFIRKDRLLAPTLGLPTPNIFNSELVKKNATPNDPWGFEWTKLNVAGGGAYQVVSRTPEQIAFTRNDKWKSGPLPKIERVAWRVVPSPSTRRALLERGDVDLSNEFPPKDIAEMEREGKLTVVAAPIDCAAQFIAMNVKMAPFDNLKVRQAVACAVPYQKILDVVLYGKVRMLADGPATVTEPVWPQPHPYRTDIAKAKQLLAEAGYPNGFETTLAFDAGSAGILEPMCVLIAESLGQIGVKVTLEKIPGSNWRAQFSSRKLPFLVNLFAGFLDFPTYYFDFAYGKTSVFNSMDYDSPEMARLIEAAKFEADPQKYRDEITAMVKLAFDDLPNIPLFQPAQYVAMQKRVTGFRYWFHRQIDYRSLAKA